MVGRVMRMGSRSGESYMGVALLKSWRSHDWLFSCLLLLVSFFLACFFR